MLPHMPNNRQQVRTPRRSPSTAQSTAGLPVGGSDPIRAPDPIGAPVQVEFAESLAFFLHEMHS